MLFIDCIVIIMTLLIGSFYNVVAIRLLKRESFVFPPSHCPQCKHSLSVLDLIPLFSYLLLKGKCCYCKTRISGLYPLGELLTCVSLFLIYKHVGFRLELIPAFVLISLLILSVLTDIRQKLILDVITLPALIILIITRIFIGEYSFWYYALGGLIGFLLLFCIALISKGGMGGGDVKLYATIGVALGPWLTMLSLVLSSFFGSLIGGVLIGTGKMKRNQPIPFGPFIFIGTLIAYTYGLELWLWYVNLW